MNYSGRKIGLVQWTSGGINHALAEGLKEFGGTAIRLPYNAPLPEDLDLIIACGPDGSLAPLANQLRALPADSRPKLAVWMTEQFSDPRLPPWLQERLAAGRIWLERAAFRQYSDGIWALRPGFEQVTRKLCRLLYFGELRWLQQEGLLTVLVVGSEWIASYLRERGFDPLVAFLGLAEDWGRDLGLERDIPILWLGKIGSRRRARLLAQVRTGLRAYGIDLLVHDGRENDYVFGEERTVLLNRTKIMLNLLRQPWDNNALRLYLTAPNGALVISEPMLAHTLLVPGVHYIEKPVGQIVNAVRYYLDHEVERQQITANCLQFIRTEMTLQKSLQRLLQAVDQRGE